MGRAKGRATWGGLLSAILLLPGPAGAHGPIFSFSPHTEFKGAVAYDLGYERHETGGEAENEYELGMHYGVTSDFTVKFDLPYTHRDGRGNTGDPQLSAKYRFHRSTDGPSLTSWTLLGGLRPDTSDDDESPGSVSLALAWGYESLVWYRWASAGIRRHAEDDADVRPGDVLQLNLAGGWRPRRPVYGEPDLVFLTELNAEFQQRARRNGEELANTGGTEVFLSPGFIWTYGRHFSLRPAVQILIHSDLNGDQAATDFRARLGIEMHF